MKEPTACHWHAFCIFELVAFLGITQTFGLGDVFHARAGDAGSSDVHNHPAMLRSMPGRQVHRPAPWAAKRHSASKRAVAIEPHAAQVSLAAAVQHRKFDQVPTAQPLAAAPMTTPMAMAPMTTAAAAAVMTTPAAVMTTPAATG